MRAGIGSKRNPDAAGDSYPHGISIANGKCDFDSVASADDGSYRLSYANSDCYSHSYFDRDTYTHPHVNSDSDTYTNCDRHFITHVHPYRCADPESDTNSIADRWKFLRGARVHHCSE